MFCGFLDGIPALVIKFLGGLWICILPKMVINGPRVLYEGCWDSHLDSKLSTSFFPYVVVVSIFLLMTTVMNWDSSRCFHALSETKTWCISGSTWRFTGLTFHYSSNVCWNCMCNGIETRLESEYLVWKDWTIERSLVWLQEIFKSSLRCGRPKNADYQKFV